MTIYALLSDAKAELKATSTADDAKLFRHLIQVSSRVDRLFQSRRPFFAPFIDQREYVVMAERVQFWNNLFYLNDNLLELTAVVLGTSTLTVGVTVEAWMLETPYHYLRLMDDGTSWYTFCNSLSDNRKPLTVKVTGVWGYHRDYANAWVKVDDLAADITAVATSMTVADADGVDEYNQTPRFSPGAFLKLDSEYIEVTATDTATNILTIRRAQNGSTAAVHSAGADVSIWRPDDAVRRVVARQAAFLYARRGAFESSSIDDAGVTNYPSDLLGELRATLQGFVYE